MLWPVTRMIGAPAGVFDELRRLQREMNRAFEGTFGGASHAAFPAVNVRADKDTVTVTAEVPGVDPKQLDISVHNGTLVLAGRRPDEALGSDELYHRQERFTGEFVRTIELPYRVDGEHVDATCANGVLTIRLPRHAEDKPRTIAVKAS